MAEKIIGILGGMGPEATIALFTRIVKLTGAKKDQDHLRVIIDSNSKEPDRTAAILGKGASLLPLLVQGCRTLQQAGADFIIMPCVSAHFYQEEMRQQITLPFVSIFDVVAETLSHDHPEIKVVGLLGTTGTVRSGLFQKRLREDGIETIVCEDKIQERVMAAFSAEPGSAFWQEAMTVYTTGGHAGANLTDEQELLLVNTSTGQPISTVKAFQQPRELRLKVGLRF